MAFETFAVHAACIRGVEAIPVTVEVSLAGGVPGIQMLGIPSMEVMESRGRIRCAMRSAGFEIPRSGITVNLAPGDIRKTGSGFDLPIAIAVLAADGQIPRDNLDRCLIAGELGLDGTVLPVKGEVAFQLLARDMGLSFIAGRSDQHVPLAGVDCGFIDHLSQLAHGMGDAARHYLDSEVLEATFEPELDYADVLGQEVAKRGMALAAGHRGRVRFGQDHACAAHDGYFARAFSRGSARGAVHPFGLGREHRWTARGASTLPQPASQHFDRGAHWRRTSGASGRN